MFLQGNKAIEHKGYISKKARVKHHICKNSQKLKELKGMTKCANISPDRKWGFVFIQAKPKNDGSDSVS